MRKHRNARTHWTTRAAVRPDGLANRALRRKLGPYAAAIHDYLAAAQIRSAVVNLIPGYVPEKESSRG